MCHKGRGAVPEDEDTCRFEGKSHTIIDDAFLNETNSLTDCRTVTRNPEGGNTNQLSFDFSNEIVVNPHFPTVFSQPLSIEVMKLKMVCS